MAGRLPFVYEPPRSTGLDGQEYTHGHVAGRYVRQAHWNALRPPAPTDVQMHLRKVYDITLLCVQRGDRAHAARALTILWKSCEWRHQELWHLGLAVAGLPLDGTFATRRSARESQEERTAAAQRRIAYLKRTSLKKIGLRTAALIELVTELIALDRHHEALGEIELVLNTYPYRSEPILHVYAALLTLHLAAVKVAGNMYLPDADPLYSASPGPSQGLLSDPSALLMGLPTFTLINVRRLLEGAMGTRGLQDPTQWMPRTLRVHAQREGIRVWQNRVRMDRARRAFIGSLDDDSDAALGGNKRVVRQRKSSNDSESGSDDSSSTSNDDADGASTTSDASDQSRSSSTKRERKRRRIEQRQASNRASVGDHMSRMAVSAHKVASIRSILGPDVDFEAPDEVDLQNAVDADALCEAEVDRSWAFQLAENLLEVLRAADGDHQLSRVYMEEELEGTFRKREGKDHAEKEDDSANGSVSSGGVKLDDWRDRNDEEGESDEREYDEEL